MRCISYNIKIVIKVSVVFQVNDEEATQSTTYEYN